ncbi:MAG: hypothetical protein RL762_969 [Bacteroidota bacterium]|jgi:hypothetical protein
MHMKYISLLLFAGLLQAQLFAQFSYGGGLSLNHFLNTQSLPNRNLSMPGIHAHLEIPRSGDVTLYGRLSYSFPKANYDTLVGYVTGVNQNINPYILAVNNRYQTSYFNIEGGNRYYIGNDYDNGFAGYGGSGIVIGIGQVRKVYDDTDITGQYSWQQSHQIDANEQSQGRIFNLGGYLQGGVKYTIPAIGTIYTDVTLNYLLLANFSNNTAAATEYLSPLYFNFAVGFKKDLY